MDEKLVKIQELISHTGYCLCGFTESCEYCNPYSAYSTLRDRIKEIINGKSPVDYGACIEIKLD